MTFISNLFKWFVILSREAAKNLRASQLRCSSVVEILRALAFPAASSGGGALGDALSE